MGFSVHEEDFEPNAQQIVDLWLAVRPDQALPPRRFDWLYRQNPDGRAVLWTIRDDATGTLAGMAIGLPRRIMVAGREQTCWNGADFIVHPRYRTLGIAIKLRRAATRGVDAGRVAFLYAHPNERMQLIHERVGHVRIGTMLRLARPLRSLPYLERFVSRRIASIASAVTDPLLRLLGPELGHRFTHSVAAAIDCRFDSRFDDLFDRCASIRPIIGLRDARYLNWRYADNPLHPSMVVTAELDGRLVGYAVVALLGHSAAVKDLLAVPGTPAIRDLVARALLECRARNLQSIGAVALEGAAFLSCLEEFGFVRRRDTSAMFGYAPTTSPLRRLVLRGDAWYLTVGDRDV